MAKQISWEPRLHEIRRSVTNSVRSHYDRNDLQQLFKLQPRGAGKLLEMLPTIPIGRANMVSKEALKTFLDGAHEADDVAAYCAEQRSRRQARSRRKPRELVRRDFDPVTADSLSAFLRPGELRIQFDSLDQLSDALWRVATALQDDLDNFSDLYELEKPPEPESDGSRDMRALLEELRVLQAKRMGGNGHPPDTEESPPASNSFQGPLVDTFESLPLRHFRPEWST